MFALKAGATYLVVGQALARGAADQPVTIALGRRQARQVLGEMVFPPERIGGQRLADCAFLTDIPAEENACLLWVENPNPDPIAFFRFTVWLLDADYARQVRQLFPFAIDQQLLNAATEKPLRRLAGFPDELTLYENPEARDLATLVAEVRPAPTEQDAARGIVAAADRPVREVAYVVAPGGRSGNLELPGPRHFATGEVALKRYRGHDFTVATRAAGESFLVLTVTNALGWSASVDGKPVPIHRVDGPLMGVLLPPGEHTVRMRYRPVLVEIGTGIAVGTFGLAGLAVGVAAWRRRRLSAGAKPPSVATAA